MQTCADPGARVTKGPLYAADLGADWTAQTPLVLPSGAVESGAGLVVADLTGDGRLDVFLPNYSPCQLFVGQPNGLLIDESKARLPTWDEDCEAWGASAVDADNDGDMDLFVARNGFSDRLWLNDGNGVFAADPAGVGLSPHRCGSRGGSWGDFDADGDLDLFVPRHHVVVGASAEGCPDRDPLPDRDIPPGDRNSLYENLGDGTFRDITERLPQGGVDGYAFLGGWLDADGDGHLDLYVINDYGGRAEPNQLLLGDGLGGFTPADDALGLHLAIDGMGLGIGDVNRDGAPDLAVSDTDHLHLMLSDGAGGWYDAARALGLIQDIELPQRASWAIDLADMDNDGDLDVMTVFGPTEGPLASGASAVLSQPDAVFLQGEDGTFTDRAAAWGLDQTSVGRGQVLVDYNGDGWLDVFKTDYRLGRARAWMSRCGDAAWLRIRLHGAPPLTHAWGARVDVLAGGQTHTRWLTPTSTGLASAGPEELHFGLGDLDVVEGMVVTWPDGSTSTFEPFEARQVLDVDQSASQVGAD